MVVFGTYGREIETIDESRKSQEELRLGDLIPNADASSATEMPKAMRYFTLVLTIQPPLWAERFGVLEVLASGDAVDDELGSRGEEIAFEFEILY